MMPNRRFLLVLVLFALLGVPRVAHAQDALDKARVMFLQGQHWQTIQECTTVINANRRDDELSAQANYLVGASYANLFDFLSAKKSFQVIVDKYARSSRHEDALLALGDVEFLQENFQEALRRYLEFQSTHPSSKRLATLYFRLADLYLRLGQKEESRKYLEILRSRFPDSFEAKDSTRILVESDLYTVQVGAFTNYDNADKFIAQLKAKGYDVYSVLCLLEDKKLCRIRIGKFRTEQEAEDLKAKLEAEGYFAKIFPVESP